MTAEAWDNARLSTAYTAMTAARLTPPGLEARVLAALRTPSIRPRPAPRLRGLHPVVPSFGALAIALIVVVALGSLARDGVAVPGGSPAAPNRSINASTPGSTPTISSVLGIPVISVPELIDRRTRRVAPSPVEVAVRGWMVRSNVVYDCALDPDPHVLVPHCLSPVFLMERPERSPGTSTDGPSVVPVLGLDSHIEIDIPWQEPIAVIAIGHYDDHRWPTCLPAEQDACRRAFVADRIVPANASIPGPPDPWRIPRSSSIEPSTDGLEVISRLQAQLGDISVVSVGHVAAGLLSEIEPAVKDRGEIDSAISVHPVWIIRALVEADPEPGVASTFIIADLPVSEPALPIWGASEDGVAPLPEQDVSLRWIPKGADVVELPFDVGAGRPKILVAVVDQTGHLVEARVPTANERAARDLSMRAVWVDDLSDGRVLVQWGGSMCDDRLTLTISASFTLAVDGRRGSPCRLALVHYAVVLTFDPAIPAADLAGRYLIGP